MAEAPEHPSAKALSNASAGFDHLFANQLDEARNIMNADDSAFHLLGQGVCAFIQAALGMEKELMGEASRLLSLSEVASRKLQKYPKSIPGQRFPPGTEYEVLNADAVVLLGLTNALSESYMGYLQCMYSLNSAHSKFTKLYKTVFPNGLDSFRTPAATPVPTPTPSRKNSAINLRKAVIASSLEEPKVSRSILGRAIWGSSSTSLNSVPTLPDGPVEDFIQAGTAFGFGLFNLVFSMLPAKVRSVAGFLGFKHDRKLALQALAVSAAKKDVHSIFSGLVLMTYHGLVLLFTGYQADEHHILKQYRAIVESIDSRYPDGALWILNRAKILRMSYDAEGAINVLKDGLSPERTHTFAQADVMLAFELAWILLSQRQYKESAEVFMKLLDISQWSHATYTYIAAGCYVSIGDFTKAQEIYDKIPNLMDKRKIGGKEIPTEVFIKKRLEFYKQKQIRRGSNEAMYCEAMKISPADEFAIFWNTHSRISKEIAEAHIKDWEAITPAVSSTSSQLPSFPPTATSISTDSGSQLFDLDTPDEFALRYLMLGIVYRRVENFSASLRFLSEAQSLQNLTKVSTWIPGVALFENAVSELKEAESSNANASQWSEVISSANAKLDQALSLSSGSSIDLGSRVESRIALQRDEINNKKELLGIS